MASELLSPRHNRPFHPLDETHPLYDFFLERSKGLTCRNKVWASVEGSDEAGREGVGLYIRYDENQKPYYMMSHRFRLSFPHTPWIQNEGERIDYEHIG